MEAKRVIINNRHLHGLLLPVVLLLVWAACSYASLWSSYVLPGPGGVAVAAWQMLTNGSLQKHILVSFYRVFAGFFLALLLAFPLGVLSGMYSRCHAFFQPLLEFIRHIPPLALMPMLILWFGIGEMPKLLIVVLATFFPIFLNTLHGVEQCDAKLIEVGKSFKMTRREIFRRIILPSALPAVLVGMRLGLGYSWRALIGAELIAASSGIGYMILDAEQLARPDVVLVGVLIIGGLGSLIDWGFFGLTRKLVPWKEGEGAGYGKG